jgi:hypothetical protein
VDEFIALLHVGFEYKKRNIPAILSDNTVPSDILRPFQDDAGHFDFFRLIVFAT